METAGARATHRQNAEPIAGLEARNLRRAMLFAAQCQRLTSNDGLVVAPSHGFVWCPNAKVGTTTSRSSGSAGSSRRT